VPHAVPRQVRVAVGRQARRRIADPIRQSRPACLPSPRFFSLHSSTSHFAHRSCLQSARPSYAPAVRGPRALMACGILQTGRSEASCPGLGTELARNGNWDRRGDEVCTLAIFVCDQLVSTSAPLPAAFSVVRVRFRAAPHSVSLTPRRTPWRFMSTIPSLLCMGCSSTT